MNIVVLAGGASPEREVSLCTGSMVCRALKERGHQAILIDLIKDYDIEKNAGETWRQWDKVGETAPDPMGDGEGAKALFGEGVLKLCKMADRVFLALHGAEGENGKIQGAFDLLGISYTGCGSLPSALAMNKLVAKRLFVAEGIPTPDFYVVDQENAGEGPRSCPCVVKPINGGSSIGVSIVRDEGEWMAALEEAFRYESRVLVEEYVEGREFSVGILDGEALPVIEIQPEEGFYDYKNKYQPGRTLEECPADISEELTVRLQDCALWAAKTLEIDSYGRVDFMVDVYGEVYCLEVNTLPGMTPTSLLPQEARAAGISFGELCEQLIRSDDSSSQ